MTHLFLFPLTVLFPLMSGLTLSLSLSAAFAWEYALNHLRECVRGHFKTTVISDFLKKKAHLSIWVFIYLFILPHGVWDPGSLTGD